MSLCVNFDNIHHIVEYDTIVFSAARTTSESRILDYSWSLDVKESLGGAVVSNVWSGTGFEITLPALRPAVANLYLTLSVRTVDGLEGNCVKELHYAISGDDAPSLEIEALVIPDTILASGTTTIPLTSSATSQDGSTYFVRTGSYWLARFRDENGSVFHLGLKRTPSGLLILKDPPASATYMSYYDGEEHTRTIDLNPLIKSDTTTVRRTEYLKPTQPKIFVDGTGWNVEYVRIGDTDLKHSSVVITDGSQGIDLELSDSFFQSFTKDEFVTIGLYKDVEDPRTPVLEDGEFSKAGLLELIYAPFSSFEVYNRREPVTITRGVGLSRFSTYFYPENGTALFGSKPYEGIYEQ